MPTTANEVGWRGAPPSPWAQFGNFGAVASNHEGLAARDSIEYLSPMVTQLTYCHGIHSLMVSPVRQSPSPSSNYLPVGRVVG
jgi:hypothetical protein